MNWYINRLKSMGPGEIAWRARNAARIPLEWVECKAARNASANSDEQRPQSSPPHPFRKHVSDSPVHYLSAFDLEFPLGHAFDWHFDYKNGVSAPRRFSRFINIRDVNVVGDVKYIWEINRHQFLSALAYSSNGREWHAYIETCIREWISANPYMEGVNWTSSLEIALRLISWCLVFAEIGPASGLGDDNFARSVRLHMRAIASNFSRFSSANNHLIGEAAGLYIGCLCFPLWSETSQWKELAKVTLENEIRNQVTEDGVNREATSYGLFTLELFLLSLLAGQNCGEAFSSEYLSRIWAMLRFLEGISTTNGELPWFGDSDDARGFLVSPSETNFRVVMDLGAHVFEEPRFAKHSRERTTACNVLMPTRCNVPYAASRVPRNDNNFVQGGIGVLDGNSGVKLVMDYGPLGYTSIAAHGHADALSVLLAIDGSYWLVDPGTYAYHAHPDWRTYFRSTAAHNTARVDGLDQSVMAGKFLWGRKAKARLLAFHDDEASGEIFAEHDGYSRLDDPVLHQRRVRFDKRKSEITITDQFISRKKHQVELYWHFHPRINVKSAGPGIVEAEQKGRRLVLKCEDADVHSFVAKGQQNPILGWYSPRFNQKEPAYVACSTTKREGDSTVTTNMRIL